MARSTRENGSLTLAQFLDGAAQFRLGDLPTEQPHPRTRELAELARTDLGGALAALKAVDRDALSVLIDNSEVLEELSRDIAKTFDGNGRVFLCGCGATGRLALSLERLWREQNLGTDRRSGKTDAVISLMAGGDAALIRSIEGFEDHPEYGQRHLDELGFGSDDLLIAITEGGETPYVIGAAERGASVSKRRPWFVYCNPDEVLRGIDRSWRVIESDRIRSVSLPIGPMALSGSTRMQATTVQMLAVGLPLLQPPGTDFKESLERFQARLDGLDIGFLASFIEAESAIYDDGGWLLYEVDRYAITVLTDTTERAPTFNLTPFENRLEDNAASRPTPSLCYLVIPSASDSAEGWKTLLFREPRPLEWSGLSHLTGQAWLDGFDFTPDGARWREGLLGGRGQDRFTVARQQDDLTLSLGELKAAVSVGDLSLVEEHILLKLLLNMHSTLVMGRLGRYESNVMTWVRPSNRKLIDRAIRYVDQLLRVSGGPSLSYEELAQWCFDEMASLGDDESIVLKTVEGIRASETLASRPEASAPSG